MGSKKVELQFLQNHKDLYLELQCYIEFAIASRAAISAEPQGSVSGVTSRSFVGGGYLACKNIIPQYQVKAEFSEFNSISFDACLKCELSSPLLSMLSPHFTLQLLDYQL